ncbi:hypothetical protein RB213_007023 [Colletotrichum asianum]
MKELETIEEKVELEGKLQAIAKDAADSLNIIDLDLKGSDGIVSSLELPLCGSRAVEYDVLHRLMTRGLNVAGEILGILNGLKIKIISKLCGNKRSYKNFMTDWILFEPRYLFIFWPCYCKSCRYATSRRYKPAAVEPAR